MTGIPVTVTPATAEGRIYPRYRNTIGILTLSTQLPRPCSFGINIDGSLILDFDEGGLLASVELLLPMNQWRGKASTSPPRGSAANLLLARADRKSAEHKWPVTVSKNVQTGSGRVAIGNGDYNRAISLSETCSALLLDYQLTGFWFALGRESKAP